MRFDFDNFVKAGYPKKEVYLAFFMFLAHLLLTALSVGRSNISREEILQMANSHYSDYFSKFEIEQVLDEFTSDKNGKKPLLALTSSGYVVPTEHFGLCVKGSSGKTI